MFVLLLTMTCNQRNEIQILYNIYVSVSNKYLLIILIFLGVNQPELHFTTLHCTIQFFSTSVRHTHISKEDLHSKIQA